MAFMGGYVVVIWQNRSEGGHSVEKFAGADLHKRVTQLAVLREGQPPSQFRFANDPQTVHGVLKNSPEAQRSRSRPRVHGVVCREGEGIGTRGFSFSSQA